MKNVIQYYDTEYFNNFQKDIGEFGGKANLFKFEEFISKDDVVLDFGCGGGFLLDNLTCFRKVGIEVNDIAREYCILKGLECYRSLDSVEDNSMDVIISNHCLEHTAEPLSHLTSMFSKLKIGGRIIIVLPLDSYKYKWDPNDVNKHLYSFSLINLGNLLDAAGFEVVKTEIIWHKWPPYFNVIKNLLGWNIFHMICRIYGRMNLRYVQIRGIGIKK